MTRYEAYYQLLREYEKCPQLFEDIHTEAEAVSEAAAFAAVTPIFENGTLLEEVKTAS